MASFFRRSNNRSTNNGNNGYNGQSRTGGRQTFESQMYANKQVQQMEQIKTRVMVEQIGGVIETLEDLLEMVQDKKSYGDTKLNLMTDMLVKSCNFFARNCHSYHQQGYKKALQLAQKKVHDHWESLDKETFDKTVQYRDFLMTAIKTPDLQQMNKRRVKTRREQEMIEKALQDPKQVNAAWSQIIYEKAKFDQDIERYKENPDERVQEHEKQLAEFKKNKKYHQNNNVPQQLPHESKMYFTKTGQSAKFSFKDGVNKDTNEKLDAEIMGFSGMNSNDNNQPQYNFMNAFINLSPENKLGPISYPIPCLLLAEPPKSGKVHVHLAQPFYKKKGFQIDVVQYDIIRNESAVERCEQEYMASKNIKELGPGYKSIIQQCQALLGCDEDENGDVEME